MKLRRNNKNLLPQFHSLKEKEVNPNIAVSGSGDISEDGNNGGGGQYGLAHDVRHVLYKK